MPLKWVRWDSDIFNSHKWLSTPMDERGVWAHLVLLAGLDNDVGRFSGTPQELAVVLRCDPELVERTLQRFWKFGALRKRGDRWTVANFDKYNPPSRYLSHEQRGSSHDKQGGSVATKRDDTVRDETIRDETVIGVLRGIRGWNADEELDADMVVKLRADFPSLDLVEESKKYAAWCPDGAPHRKNHRLGFRNWCSRAVQFAARDKHDVVRPLPSIDEQDAAQRAKWRAS